jgi:hypothetical protein
MDNAYVVALIAMLVIFGLDLTTWQVALRTRQSARPRPAQAGEKAAA